jgi:hypothetical protein
MMMPSTPQYAIPYPAGTDRVMDGDNAMGTLAGRIETRMVGLLAYQELTTSSFSATAEAATGLSVSANILSGHRIWVEAFWPGICGAAAGRPYIKIYLQSTGVQVDEHDLTVSAHVCFKAGRLLINQLAAGSQTFSLNAGSTAGSTMNASCSATMPAWIKVLDYGAP